MPGTTSSGNAIFVNNGFSDSEAALFGDPFGVGIVSLGGIAAYTNGSDVISFYASGNAAIVGQGVGPDPQAGVFYSGGSDAQSIFAETGCEGNAGGEPCQGLNILASTDSSTGTPGNSEGVFISNSSSSPGDGSSVVGLDAEVTGDYSMGVYSETNGATPYGVYGNAYSTGGGAGAIGVEGEATGDSPIGVYGETEGEGPAAWFDGDVYAFNYYYISDFSLSNKIRPIEVGLDKIMALKPKSYELHVDRFKKNMNLQTELSRSQTLLELASR